MVGEVKKWEDRKWGIDRSGKIEKILVIFDNSFWEYKEKIIFLYFWNKKHVWLVKIKKIFFLKKKIENIKTCCY